MKTILSIVGVTIILIAGAIGWNMNQEQSLGSVNTASEYTYWSTEGKATGTKIIILDGAGTLGSVIINESSAHAFNIWDNASTTEATTTPIGTLKASAVEGTYTYDVNFYNGLMIQSAAGFAGDYTATYRQR